MSSEKTSNSTSPESYLQPSTAKGSVKDLMTPGLAAEFKQPWYTPLTTTPQTTGMALGGIGSTFTVTPAGTTPILNSVPGIQIRDEKYDSMRLSDFFVSERDAYHPPMLVMKSFARFQVANNFYTLKNERGQAYFDTSLGEAATAESLSQAVLDKQLFSWNRENLERWHIEFSPRTRKRIEHGDTSSPEFNRLWLLDFFGGAVIDADREVLSLTCDWESEEISGIKTFPSAKAEYRTLYPFSETTYDRPEKLKIKKIQYSPVIPGDQKMSSLPVQYTRIILSNPGETTREFTVAQSLENLCGFQAIKDRPGVQDASFVLQRNARFQKGEVLDLSTEQQLVQGVRFFCEPECMASDFAGEAGLAVQAPSPVSVTVKPQYYRAAEEDVLSQALQTGSLNTLFDKGVYSGRELMSGAVCASGTVAPGESVELLFVQVLDFPEIQLPGLNSRKKYTNFFPTKEKRVSDMIRLALEVEPQIVPAWEEWFAKNLSAPEGLFSDENALNRFQTLACNTLSFLAEATVWDTEDRFLVRECADYPFFNSLDVYFYGSFSLLQLFPELDGQVMRRFADAVLAEGDQIRRHHEYVGHPYADLPHAKLEGPRSVKGAVIHDLGSPFDARPDAYDWHNVKEWKDLAPKFVLMVLRHYVHTGNKKILEDCKDAVWTCMEYLQSMVEPGQLFPLTRGTDDTFDNLSSHGISVYCGSLWIAGLQAWGKIAGILGDENTATKAQEKVEQCTAAFDEALWDEAKGYYHFFVTPVSVNDLQNADLMQTPAKELLDELGKLGIELNGDESWLESVNHWLCSDAVPKLAENLEEARKQWEKNAATHGLPKEWISDWSGVSRRTLRAMKKLMFSLHLQQWLNENFQEKIWLDSDDVFADQMLADSYLSMLGLAPISAPEQKQRALQKVISTNYHINSPRLGAANLVAQNGDPKEWHNFQAHDVWIGIQYSLATSLLQAGKPADAVELLETVYTNLYKEARIPFAAPEGFNGTCRLEKADLESMTNDSAGLLEALTEKEILQPDHRISFTLTKSAEEFRSLASDFCQKFSVDSDELFSKLHATGLKYTAGRYFRPGMVFSIPLVWK